MQQPRCTRISSDQKWKAHHMSKSHFTLEKMFVVELFLLLFSFMVQYKLLFIQHVTLTPQIKKRSLYCRLNLHYFTKTDLIIKVFLFVLLKCKSQISLWKHLTLFNVLRFIDAVFFWEQMLMSCFNTFL